MRWFVEVSRVGEGSSSERYCIEAKAWQTALQEARKLRGDSGPLSKFSIELLDDGYRAVNPVQKVRYVVNQAPADAALSAPVAASNGSTPAQNGGASLPAAAAPRPVSPATPSLAPNAAPSLAPAAAPSLAPAAAPSLAPAAAPSLAPAAAPSLAPAAAPSLAPRPASAPKPAPSPPEQSAVPSVSQALAPAAVVSVPPGPMPARVTDSERLKAEAPKAPPESPRDNVSAPPAAAAPVTPFAAPRPSVAPVVAPSAARLASAPPPVFAATTTAATTTPLPLAMAPTPPAHRILSTRLETPRPETPLTYREEVYVVDPGTPRDAVETLLLERFQRVRSELAAGPAGQLVRLAVFDIAFEGAPPRPPLGTLAWKDWRGTPVLGFPSFGIEAPLVTSSLPPRPGSDSPSVAAPPNPVPQPFESSISAAPAAPRSNGAPFDLDFYRAPVRAGEPFSRAGARACTASAWGGRRPDR